MLYLEIVLMLRDDPLRPHRDTVNYIRSTITSYPDRQKIDDANEQYIRAKAKWSTLDNDETMINLVGTWSRVSRIIREMDNKYGR